MTPFIPVFVGVLLAPIMLLFAALLAPFRLMDWV